MGGIVQGNEGPVCGVAQVVDCHGVTVGHQEKEEEVKKQEDVEGEGETLKEHCMDGMRMERKDKCERP